MNKKIFSYITHVPIWIVAFFIAYFFSTDSFTFSIDILYCTLDYAFWFLGSFYTFYLYLVPRLLEKGKYITFSLCTILFILIVMPGINVFLFQITGISALSLPETFSEKGFNPWIGDVLGTLFCGGLGTMLRFSIDWFNYVHLRKDLENIKLQSELNAIKSRLNPHFLFNSLNNIDTLIQTNQEKASVALSKLSNLLRYVVYETEKEMISIQKEIDILVQYIDLEKMRLSYPDSISFSNSVLKEILVPPLIFLPFIENGFKHSNLNKPGQKIDIIFSEKNNELLFKCINTINYQRENINEKGIGIKLVKKRLELLYPENYSLDIKQIDNMYSVTLKINLSND